MRRSGGGWGLRRVISFKFRKNDTANYFVGFVFFPIQFIFTLKSIFCNILNKTKKRGKKKDTASRAHTSTQLPLDDKISTRRKRHGNETMRLHYQPHTEQRED